MPSSSRSLLRLSVFVLFAACHHGEGFIGPLPQVHLGWQQSPQRCTFQPSRHRRQGLDGAAVIRQAGGGRPAVVSSSFSRRGAFAASRTCVSRLYASTPKNEEYGNSKNSKLSSSSPGQAKTESDDENCLQRILSNLAKLSLEDYKWRSNIFKTNEADRMLEESMSRLRGNDPNYVRPMDARAIGPLGTWEKNAVEWLSQVIDEEGRRAEQIVRSDGKLVRPKDAVGSTNELGPLGFLEKTASDFVQSIRNAEVERVKARTLRPKDMDASLRGPLGEAEFRAIRILTEIQESEKLRNQQSKLRGGELVRPIDVPGPLGEFEMAVLEIFDAEQKRARERERTSGRLVRPMDAKFRGPLGEAELKAYETIKKLSAEESERLESIKRVLRDNRPMEIARDSFLGVLETVVVGIIRAPIVLVGVVARVVELLSSETLDQSDKDIIQKRIQTPGKPESPDKRRP